MAHHLPGLEGKGGYLDLFDEVRGVREVGDTLLRPGSPLVEDPFG